MMIDGDRPRAQGRRSAECRSGARLAWSMLFYALAGWASSAPVVAGATFIYVASRQRALPQEKQTQPPHACGIIDARTHAGPSLLRLALLALLVFAAFVPFGNGRASTSGGRCAGKCATARHARPGLALVHLHAIVCRVEDALATTPTTELVCSLRQGTVLAEMRLLLGAQRGDVDVFSASGHLRNCVHAQTQA